MSDTLFRFAGEKTFAFSAENPTGTPSGGSRGGDCTKLHPRISIAPGEIATLVDTDGPGMIQSIWFGGYMGHSYILRIYWEGNDIPSVEAPLSAFFGCAYDENVTTSEHLCPVLNSSLIMVGPSRSFNSYFQMPFRRHCKITLENRGKQVYNCYYIITGCRMPMCELPPEEEMLYFHASYRQAHPVTRGKCYTVIDGIRGKGKFLGLTLAVGLNGFNSCWVEGEARMYIDGGKYPSVHYTGTEDYFGGSFAFGKDKAPFRYQPYSGQYVGMFAVLGDMDEMYNNQQRFLLYRFHVPDPICFEQDFRMTLDNLGWAKVGEQFAPRYDDYTSVAYWYQTLPAAPFVPLPSDDDCFMK